MVYVLFSLCMILGLITDFSGPKLNHIVKALSEGKRFLLRGFNAYAEFLWLICLYFIYFTNNALKAKLNPSKCEWRPDGWSLKT